MNNQKNLKKNLKSKNKMKNLKSKYIVKEISIEELYQNYKEGKWKSNNSLLQRRIVSKPDWGSNLVASIMQGNNCNPFHIVPTLGVDNDRLFIDGKNRADKIVGFFENRVFLPAYTTVTIINDEGKEELVELTGEKKVKYNALVKGRKNIIDLVFNQRKITIIEYLPQTSSETAQTFKNINDSHPLKEQEKRNSHTSNFAELPRYIARGKDEIENNVVVRTTENHPIFDGQKESNHFKADLLKNNNERYVYDETIAKIVYYELKGFPKNDVEISSKYLDKLYDEYADIDETALNAVKIKINSILDIMLKIINNNQPTISTCNFVKKPNDFLYFYTIISTLKKRYEIRNYQVFLNTYIQSEKALLTYEATDVDGNKRIERIRGIKGEMLVRNMVRKIESYDVNGLIKLDEEISYDDSNLHKNKILEQDFKCAYSGQTLTLTNSVLVPIVPAAIQGEKDPTNNCVVVLIKYQKLRNKAEAWFDFLMKNELGGIEGDSLPPIEFKKVRQIQSQLSISDNYKRFLKFAINDKALELKKKNK